MGILKDLDNVWAEQSYPLQHGLEEENSPQKAAPDPSVFFPWRENVACESHCDLKKKRGGVAGKKKSCVCLPSIYW